MCVDLVALSLSFSLCVCVALVVSFSFTLCVREGGRVSLGASKKQNKIEICVICLT